jgi:hypothetical protein
MKKNRGVDHPGTLTAMERLAEVCGSLQRYSDAETLLGQALTICEKKYGAERLHTLACEAKPRSGPAPVIRRPYQR